MKNEMIVLLVWIYLVVAAIGGSIDALTIASASFGYALAIYNIKRKGGSE